MGKSRGAVDRNFEAFEAGALKAELRNEKIAGQQARMQEMEAERQGLEARRERLELSAIDRETLASLVDNFENVMAEGPNPKKKHLLHLLVKKVLIHSRKTVEIWYVLPNSQRFANCTIWLPICNRLRTHPGWVEPEVWFRVVHLAQDAQSGTRTDTYREQIVDIALGPKGAFENANIGALTRRVSADWVVDALPPLQGNLKPPKVPRTPRVVELLRKAIEWQILLESGEIVNKADIAQQEGITRARVPQVMGVLRLAPENQERILSMPDGDGRPSLTERMLHPMERSRISAIGFGSFRGSCPRHLNLRLADGHGGRQSLRHSEGNGGTRISRRR